MKKILLELLNKFSHLLNQLPDDEENKEIRHSPLQKKFNPLQGHTRPHDFKKPKPDTKRKGPRHSDEKIFNHPRD